MTRNYWLTVFTVETWNEFQHHGGDVAGFGEKRWASVQRIRPGDHLLCYLTGVSRFAGLLEAVGEPFFDWQPIWKSRPFPSRVPVQTILALDPEEGVPVLEMREQLSIFRKLSDPKWWSGYFQTSPSRWSPDDAEVVVKALRSVRASGP
jgi:hypothetical protein